MPARGVWPASVHTVSPYRSFPSCLLSRVNTRKSVVRTAEVGVDWKVVMKWTLGVGVVSEATRDQVNLLRPQ